MQVAAAWVQNLGRLTLEVLKYASSDRVSLFNVPISLSYSSRCSPLQHQHTTYILDRSRPILMPETPSPNASATVSTWKLTQLQFFHVKIPLIQNPHTYTAHLQNVKIRVSSGSVSSGPTVHNRPVGPSSDGMMISTKLCL